MSDSEFVDEHHAFATGALMGALHSMDTNSISQILPNFDEAGNYTNQFSITIEGRQYVLTLTPASQVEEDLPLEAL